MKFNIGDTVYIVEKRTKEDRIDCPICGGYGRAETKTGYWINCQKSKIIKSEVYYVPNYKIDIESIIIQKDVEPMYVDGSFDKETFNSYEPSLGSAYFESELFTTKKEAQEFCDKMNNEN